MVLTKEDRIQLLSRAREAKAKKRVSVKEEETEDEEETPVINVPMPEPEPEPPKPEKKKTGRKPKEVVPLPVPVEVIQIEEELPVPKKRSLPAKWLKQIKTEPEKVCCDAKLTKEKPVIDDAPQTVAETIVIPSKKEIKKPRLPRASAPTRTLELTEPTPIEDVIEDLKKGNEKYLPKIKQTPPPSTPQQPIQIKRMETPLKLFNY